MKRMIDSDCDMEITKPNIWSFAGKELSHDAVFCWLLLWADHSFANADSQLHTCGKKFVEALLRLHGCIRLPDRYQVVGNVFPQDGGIDVLVRISPNHVLLIENKANTGEHSNQRRVA